MTRNAKNAAQATQNVAFLTVEIGKLESPAGTWDGAKLTSLYTTRGQEITAALRNGASAESLSDITGNGR